MIIYVLCSILNVYHEHTWLEHKIIRANVTVQQQKLSFPNTLHLSFQGKLLL